MSIRTNSAGKDVHSRLATVQGGELDQWVVVAYGTREEFAAGKVGEYVIDADEHCTRDCPGEH